MNKEKNTAFDTTDCLIAFEYKKITQAITKKVYERKAAFQKQ